AAINAIKDVLGSSVELRRQEFVGPQVGEELIQAGLLAIIFSLIGILIYVWLRFEWQFAVGAVAALVHDTIATIALFSLTQMEFNLSTVAAVLTIAGYSINDTVVVFDRMRENLRKYKRETLINIIDRSLNETLTRTLLTSGTTLIALIALWAFGGEVIRGFTIALIWGIIIGTYSSIFIAAPLLIFLNLRPEQLNRVSGDKSDQAAIRS
ncbi:MAG: protein translocase subunit SecF, partial [Pseudomonadota bacterium]